MEVKKLGVLVLSVFLMLCFGVFAVAEDGIGVEGKYYEFDEKNEYEISSAKDSLPTSKSDTYGDFLLEGKIESTGTKNGVAAYTVEGTNLNLIYKYDDSLLNADIDSWHLCEDKTKKIDGYDIGEKIQKGAILVQTSIDCKNWNNVKRIVNAFEESSKEIDVLYEANDIELLNGCYYRVIVVYEIRKRTQDSNILFLNTDKFEYSKRAEEYEFYVITKNSNEKPDKTDYSQTYRLGDKVRVEDFDEYWGSEEITNKDIHYGWDIGDFFVSGYTSTRGESNEEPIFLKNSGDEMVLWFCLKQNIDALNGNNKLSITSDEDGCDRYFNIPITDFGKGALIVRYTDKNNNKTQYLYKDYLKANTSLNANTKVKLLQEGDYEVALDYEVTSDGLVNKVGHYRIFFKFSVRNSNNMVYLFDRVNNKELHDKSITKNGFKINCAGTEYLDVVVKRYELVENYGETQEDLRYDRAAKDGFEYTEEGIYEIKFTNKYTNETDTKRIYVGDDNISKIYVKTGLEISFIKELIDNGVEISSDGELTFTPLVEVDETESVETEDTKTKSDDVASHDENKTTKNNLALAVIIIEAVLIVVMVGVICALLFKVRKMKVEKGGERI